jgi:hypothetical protein
MLNVSWTWLPGAPDAAKVSDGTPRALTLYTWRIVTVTFALDTAFPPPKALTSTTCVPADAPAGGVYRSVTAADCPASAEADEALKFAYWPGVATNA